MTRVRKLALLACVIASATFAASAQADAPRDGWGFGIADDGGAATLNTQFFDRLRPKTFRFMVPWYAAISPSERQRAETIIFIARAKGAQEITVSFNEGSSEAAPSTSDYSAAVGAFIQLYAPIVDAWGPANEPNCGGGWQGLNGTSGGAQRTAQMYNILLFIARAHDPSARVLSPDFCDSFEGNSISPWMNAYKAAGGGFGDVIAWHPYWDTHYRGLARVPGPNNTYISSTQNLINNVNGNPIWVTEVGGLVYNPGHGGIVGNETTQNEEVGWVASTLANNNRIRRIHYFSMKGNPFPGWDTGLLRSDGTRRPSWYTWCVESHGGAAFHPDCWG